ncbi:hypothetical protein QBC46DRAFT_448146 [Diplogelasinospora grovesii]|uniref:Uncharacterized protein n=1 Tax=Diplogelasinospora grovesii TaxID=303347 RepID=A0AAN6S6C4_9PEZI|nr:hypothetical protein QBC46DRAFT_448146 [Diplogelasinospora grovesii]
MMLPDIAMGQEGCRAVFDSLLAKTHVGHALVQPDGSRNTIPTMLATVVLLGGTSDQLHAVYELKKAGLRSWQPSPRNIANEEDKICFLGDERFLRAYMTYFSMENGKLGGNSTALAVSQLVDGSKPLIYGLFAGIGQPLIFLSDAMELQAAVLVVESLVLCAVDWKESIYELLTDPLLAGEHTEPLSPEELLTRVAYDGRLSGLMKVGPGFHWVSHILSNPLAREAVIEYVHRLNCRDLRLVLNQLASLSAMLACATHKPSEPAFDFYLSYLPTYIACLRVLLGSPGFHDSQHTLALVRGVWLLFIFTYITQLRPILDAALLTSVELPGTGNSEARWEAILAEFRSQPSALEGKYSDLQFLRTLRSLRVLGEAAESGGDKGGHLYMRAAWKLVCQWRRWTGLGDCGEQTLNIRL